MARDEQMEIEGTEQVKIPALERAADKYDEKRRIWQGLGSEMITLKAKVLEVAHANAQRIERDDNGALRYKRGDYSIELTPGKEKIKVKISIDEPEHDDQA